MKMPPTKMILVTEELDLCAQNIDTVLGSIINKIERAYVNSFER
jgi:hypothetical protein